jgi:hypothetical protein
MCSSALLLEWLNCRFTGPNNPMLFARWIMQKIYDWCLMRFLHIVFIGAFPWFCFACWGVLYRAFC